MMLEPIQFLFSENLIRYLQSHGNPFLDGLFLVITTFGSQPAYLFLASLIFWCSSKKRGIRALYVILFSAFAAIMIKNLFSMPRPPEMFHKIQEAGFGFPSGHALVSSGFWGYLGFTTKNKSILLVGTLAILFISLSRVYLGVHFAGDVAGGIIFGLSIALISIKIEPGLTIKFEKLGCIHRYFAALGFPGILVAIASMQRGLLEDQIEIGLVMAGIGVGYLMEGERIKLGEANNNRQRLKRAIVGAAVLGIIYLISSILILINPGFIFFKYAALGFASTYVAPSAISKTEATSSDLRFMR